jgi:hypothetical protein
MRGLWRCAARQTITAKHAAATDSVYGLLLMGAYLAADGLTSTTQERMFHGYSMSTYNQMLYINLCSAVISLIGALPPPTPHPPTTHTHTQSQSLHTHAETDRQTDRHVLSM